MEDWEKGTIAIGLVGEALHCMRQRGMDTDALLLQAGIAPRLLTAPHARVAAASYGRLWYLISQATDDEFFGMDSHPMRVGSFNLLCRSALHSANLGKALARMLDFLRLVLDDISASLSQQNGLACIVINEGGSPRRMFTYATFLMFVHGVGSWLIGRRIQLLSADFRCDEPLSSLDYKVRFCDQARFGQARTSITFDVACLALPIVQNQRTLPAFLREAPGNLLVKYSNHDSLAATIRRHLRQLPVNEWSDFGSLASQLQTPASTLRRKLSQEGQSYQAIKDNLRRDLAINYLSGSARSIEEIAISLGFADPSAFHRAFKKWTGSSPGEHRRALSTS
ncbi:AraC family transcriptional regulator [Collimonas sp.]|jgi:AraC-like DNA-binding protein|uniref:AraC family transcriptional regulator n=1 Tax=Collimonas sp. TaxID=1963772 RepID=UPI002C7A548A|nr:AraC family transcriptional regulator [Collimonas sp.]HWW99697.1 AraC family transcriptional regulator [Collimonas sp.]